LRSAELEERKQEEGELDDGKLVEILPHPKLA
jgi:hypothetical protein